MTSGTWCRVPLRDVAELDIERVPVVPDGEYEVAGVLIAGGGLFRREKILGSDTNYSAFHRLRSGQLVYRKLTAWEGPITVVPPAFNGAFVSSEFPTFTVDETRLLPEYLRLICQRPAFHHEMKLRSTGTAERRNRLKPADLLDIKIDLPPLEEQRRIVEDLRAGQQLLDATRAQAAAAGTAHSSLRERLISDGPWELAELAVALKGVEAGKSPKCEERRPQPGELGVLKVSAIRPGWFRADEAKVLAAGVEFPERARISCGDVLINRASGSLSLVGSVCRVETPVSNRLLSDKTLRLVINEDAADAAYVVEALATTAARAQIEFAASGSSGQKNISQKEILGFEIPLPPLPDQQRIAELLDASRAVGRRLQDELASLERVHAALLDARLADHQIGETLAA